MQIDQNIATAIVTNIKEVLRHEINLFDTEGTIIASTDVLRIGTHHAGALYAVQHKCTVCVDDDHQYEGARNGINVPVMLDGEVVAVIGVTGKREEVESFSNIIRKMTEILIRENMERAAKFDRRMTMLNLLHQLIADTPHEQVVSYLASALAFDPQRVSFVAIGRPASGSSGAHGYITGEQSDLIFTTAERQLRYFPHSIYAVTAQEICLFLDIEDLAAAFGAQQADNWSDPDTAPCVKLLLRLADMFHDELGLTYRFGIGTAARSITEFARSYREAGTALRWLQFQQNEQVCRYRDLDIGLIIPELATLHMEEYVEHIFQGLSEEQINACKTCFDAYTAHNGSITHAAQSLYIHKNTMQNHLNTIADLTGYNPRELSDYAILFFAFHIYDYLKFSRQQQSKLSL